MRIIDGLVYGAKVVGVRALDGYRLWLRFATGEEKIYDVKPLLKSAVFKPLEDRALFDSVYINAGTVMWNNDEIDLSPDCLFMNGTLAS